MTEQTPLSAEDAAVASRRRVLKLGAIGAATVVTVQPSLAHAAVSVLNCQIPVPSTSGNWIAADGTLVPIGTPGAFPGTARALTGEEVKNALQTGYVPYTQADASQAYLNYIRKLQYGQSGFTCFASVQMPR
jgi:hypothetical protein